jgi:hypothetical protein
MTSEDLRFEARAYLAVRPTAALSAVEIRHGLARKGHETGIDELTAALVFLEGFNPPQIRRHLNPLGGSSSWQITTAGVLSHERNE